MPLRLVCLHGHHLELTAGDAPTLVVCPICGCLNQLGQSGPGPASGSRELTQELPESQDLQLRSQHGNSALDTPTQFFDETVQNTPSSDGSISQTLPSNHDLEAPTAGEIDSVAGGDPVSDEPGPRRNHQRPSRAATPISSSLAIDSTSEAFTPPELDGYEVLGELGRGGMGVVYRAYEKQHGRHVALKTLQRMSPLELQHFKQEFRSLADVAHPNLASLYSLLSDGQTWCFTMELLDCVDCLSYVWSGFKASDRTARNPDDSKPHQRLSSNQLQRLKEVLQQLALGLHALHSSGMLHRDIKPSNVMVTAEGGLKLVDFGLSAEMQADASTSQPRRIQGTPEYMAPEQAACTTMGAASDWYAVGVMLYEILTGQLPVQGKPIQILVKKQRQNPPPPQEIEPGTPRDLNDLCVALLDRDPRKRPTTADVLRCIGADDLADDLREMRTGSDRQIEIVGRKRQLDQLREYYRQVEAGSTLSVFVHGKSGMGKSVLLRRFLDEIKLSGEAAILEGRCYEQESVPFKALDSLVDALAVFLNSLPASNRNELCPQDPLPLTRLFPVLGQVLQTDESTAPSIETADQPELRQRAMNGLRETLTKLGELRPLILYIDDLQWGDVDSAALLADLVRPPHAPRLLLLGSYRSEEAQTSSCLRALTEAYHRGQNHPRREELPVESLSHDDATQLAMQLLGDESAATQAYADRIARESDGWPFFVWELAQHVQDQPSDAEGSLELDEVIWKRVCRLPDETRRLLELFAVAGRPMPAPQAFEAIERVSQGPSLLAQLRANNFVRITDSGDETVVETYHDRIRESVVNHLPANTVKEQNLMLALAIERSSGIDLAELEKCLQSTADFEEPSEALQLTKQQWQRVFDLAFFFATAGKVDRAFPFALIAAEKAASQNAFQVAEEQYRIALQGAGASAEAMRFRVAEGLGEVLLMQGRYEEAAEQLKTARFLVNENVPAARIDGKLGQVAFRTGDMAAAQAHYEKGLAELGNPTPSNNVTQTIALVKEAFVQLLHTYLPSQFNARRPAGTKQHLHDMLRARLYDGLGYPYWFKKGPIPTLWTHLRHMNLAELYPPSKELGRAYTMHGVMMTAIPLAQRGADYANRAYGIHGEQGDLQHQGKARSFQTFSLVCMGRFKEGLETGQEAIRLLEQAGDVWEGNMARLITSMPLYFLGKLEESYHAARRGYEIGKETGDYSAMAIAALFWPPSAPGSIPDELMQTEIERERDDPLSESAAIQGFGIKLLLFHDKPAEAAEVLQESLDVARRRGLRNPCIFCGVTWKATALRIVAEREPPGPKQVKAIKVAKKAVADALRITRKYQAARAQSLREHGFVALLEGQAERARKAFDDSLEVARQQEAAYEYAQTLRARGLAGRKFGWPEADEQFETGTAQMAALTDFET